MHTLYPDIKPYMTHRLPVDGLHVLYIEECGVMNGLPVVVLHGGPGAGCEPTHRRFFDPMRYRIVLFDQRGAGQSTPHAELRHNTTRDLIADIEKIRELLRIDRWLVFGGSWGATLGLVYAETYPERVIGLILRGIFLLRRQDIDWFYRYGACRLFPDAWEKFLEPIAPDERSDPLRAYYQRLTGENELERLRVAKAWATWEATTLSLEPNPRRIEQLSAAHWALSLARIEAHYMVNDGFLSPDQVLSNAYRLRNIPGFIVHGRYDVICPLDNAWALHRAWPDAQLGIVSLAGHAATESGITHALIDATQRMVQRFG